MSEFGPQIRTDLPTGFKEDLWGSIISLENEIVQGNTLPLLVVHGGQVVVRRLEDLDYDRARMGTRAYNEMEKKEAERDNRLAHFIDPDRDFVLPSVQLDVYVEPTCTWTQVHIDRADHTKDTRGRNVLRLGLRELDKADLGSYEAGFKPGSVIEGYTYPETVDYDKLHFLAVDNVPVDDVFDPVLSITLDPDPEWYAE